MKTVYLVAKLGEGISRFMDEPYSDEIICATEKRLSSNITVETVIYKLGDKRITFRNYNKNDLCIFKDGIILDRKKQVEWNYFIFENLEEALIKKREMIDLLEKELIKKTERKIKEFISELKDNIKVTKIVK